MKILQTPDRCMEKLHGRYNARIQGQSDIDLNEAGREAARLTSEALKDFRFDAAYTVRSAGPGRQERSYLREENIPLIEDERLKEANFGPYEGADPE